MFDWQFCLVVGAVLLRRCRGRVGTLQLIGCALCCFDSWRVLRMLGCCFVVVGYCGITIRILESEAFATIRVATLIFYQEI